MASRQSRQQHTTSAPAASRTQTETSTPSQEQPPQDPTPEVRSQPAILRLRGVRASSGPSVRWAEGVVDNEGLGRKSSKVCCIYHPTKPVGESSDESSSDSSSDSGTDSDDSTRGKGKRKHRSGGGGGGKKHGEGDCHGHNHGHDHGSSSSSGGGGGARKKKRSAPRVQTPTKRCPRSNPGRLLPKGRLRLLVWKRAFRIKQA
ncbi:hypothetical protein OOU_Y34scaffold00697g11 [Pyricularia oryzae Y34]|uniref:Type 1 phosphatases regulator n=1 Tax=Pyricularia oryzae (strain Y34) TaxID=1143189 RepID=A0AA97PIB9_PYRO3|nr:hypothetical protein OOU_Y34scaffold00697g11 [Pyricularia oryzae Y34]